MVTFPDGSSVGTWSKRDQIRRSAGLLAIATSCDFAGATAANLPSTPFDREAAIPIGWVLGASIVASKAVPLAALIGASIPANPTAPIRPP
jgi:hypothetical protein